MKLVLIEDNADLALTMRVLLEIRGYDVKCYLRGHEFLREAAALEPQDVLITDYYLPDVNGIELVKRARAACAGVKAILLTGSREEAIVRAAREIRDCRVEYKPLDYEALERGINAIRARKGSDRPASA